jgi:2-phospho-L-lactate/phosphoenolpyruvate guanylyltransferase
VSLDYSPTLRRVLTTVVIPVKSFSMGKRRLAGFVDSNARAQLGRALAGHVASTVADAGLVPLVVTADPEVADWSTRSGFPSLPDPGLGLDGAARAGMDWVRHTSPAWLVLHADLPLLSVADVRALVSELERLGGVIAPSADGGTSAIGSRDALRFAFGVSSFHRHLRRLGRPGVVARRGLLLDIDAPQDLRAVADTPEGRWIGELVG